MSSKAKNIYAKDFNFSETAFQEIIFLWWVGVPARQASEALSKEAQWRNEKPISRESTSVIFNEIGEHLWHILFLPLFVENLVKNQRISGADATRKIKSDMLLYYRLVQQGLPAELITQIESELGEAWNPFLGRILKILQRVYGVFKGFSEDKMHVHFTRAVYIEHLLKNGIKRQDISRVAVKNTLYWFKSYPMRAILPPEEFPWAQYWDVVKSPKGSLREKNS